MTRSLLLVSLAAGALTVPIPASSAATELAIREINVRPAAPVVGTGNSVRLVIDVVAKGVRRRDGVSVKVEPGAPPGSVVSPSPGPAPDQSAPPSTPPSSPPSSGDDWEEWPTDPSDEQTDDTWDDWSVDSLDRSSDTWEDWSPAAPDEKPGRWRRTESPTWAPPAPGKKRPRDRGAAAPGVNTRDSAAPSTMAVMPGGPAVPPRHAAQGTRPSGATAQGVRPPAQGAPAPLNWRVVPSPMRMTGGWQTWRFLPDKALTRFYPAGTWTVTATAKGPDGTSVTAYASFQLKRESKLSAVQVAKAGGAQGVRLSGSLNRVDPRGRTGFAPFARQRVEIFWRQEQSGSWERVAEATTGAAGAFEHTVANRTGGYWRVRYLGTGHYASSASRIHQVNR
ncbi:hypothetical protein [Nonomuraea sp. LPB2021202275-12-8]|uniref:hypothetical protein n=1 Tax=Nonomuraea sp. LPB2021202275-12-8 TaxID=3120159 RepID=UPI00300D4F47